MQCIHTLTEAQLIAMGVPTVGARRRMLSSIDVLKRSLPAPADDPPLQPKKRNKTSAQNPAPSAAAASAAATAAKAPNAAPPPPLIPAEPLPLPRAIARITQKAADQSAAAMLAATPLTAAAPVVPFLADSAIADAVPLFPGSIMRRVCFVTVCAHAVQHRVAGLPYGDLTPDAGRVARALGCSGGGGARLRLRRQGRRGER
jgi:hypothetical protein